MSEGRRCHSLLNSTLEGVSSQIHDPVTLPWRKRPPPQPGYQLNRRLGGTHSQYAVLG